MLYNDLNNFLSGSWLVVHSPSSTVGLYKGSIFPDQTGLLFPSPGIFFLSLLVAVLSYLCLG